MKALKINEQSSKSVSNNRRELFRILKISQTMHVSFETVVIIEAVVIRPEGAVKILLIKKLYKI